MSRRAVARRYGISESAAIKWLERVERHGSRSLRIRRPSRFQADTTPRLSGGRSAETSDVTLQAHCDRLSAKRRIKADTSMMSRFFRRIGVTVKKRPLSHASRIARTPTCH